MATKAMPQGLELHSFNQAPNPFSPANHTSSMEHTISKCHTEGIRIKPHTTSSTITTGINILSKVKCTVKTNKDIRTINSHNHTCHHISDSNSHNPHSHSRRERQ